MSQPQQPSTRASANPWAAYQLQPGQQYSAQQLWGQKSRELQPAGQAATGQDALEAKMRERDQFKFPHPPPSSDNPGVMTFQPMADTVGVVSPDEHYTPIYQNPPVRPYFPPSPQEGDSQVARLLLAQARQSLQAASDQLLALETLISQPKPPSGF